MEKKRPYLAVRPQFDPGLAMVQSIFITVASFFLLTLAGGIVTAIFFMMIGLSFVPLKGIFGFYMLLSLAGTPPLFYELKKRALQRTLYNFYEDYVDFQYFQFYLNRRRGRVWYRDIGDITQHASALQEHQRLTTIFLYVPGLSSYGQRGFSGIKMEDLPQARGYLTKVMDIVQFSITGDMPAWLAQSFPQPAFTPPPAVQGGTTPVPGVAVPVETAPLPEVAQKA